jgi:hypothetical protein
MLTDHLSPISSPVLLTTTTTTSTTDVHSSYIFDTIVNKDFLPDCDRPGNKRVAVEYVGTSITSYNPGDGFRRTNAATAEAAVTQRELDNEKTCPYMINNDVDCHGERTDTDRTLCDVC